MCNVLRVFSIVIFYLIFLLITKIFHYSMGRDNSVGTATRYGLGGQRLESRWGSEISRSSPDWPSGPASLLYSGYRVCFTEVKLPGRGVDQWRTEGCFGGFKPPPPKFRRPSKIVPNSTRLWKLLKITEFRTPTPQDVRKKGSKILKLPRFTIVLH